MPEIDVKSIRDRIPVLSKYTYLNCGTFGPMPTPVADELRRLYRLIEEHGPLNPEVSKTLRDVYEGARTRSASLLGAKPIEIALNRSVSDGINIVSQGYDWNQGDEVILGNEEHESGFLPWLNLSRRRGIVLRLLPFTADARQFIQNLDSLITPRTRMIFLSHISCRSGLRIPAKEACAVARDRGIPIMLDGAHVAGQMPIDVRDIGCDFYSTCGHKWLLAPQGIGILYLREDRLKDVQVSWCGWGMDAGPELARAGGLDNNRLAFEPLQEARKFEYGTRPYALYGGLNAAIDMASEIGLVKIEARIRNLASRVKKQLSEVPGVRLLTPLDPGFSSGLVAFSHPGIKHPSPGQWLWEKHRTLVSHKPQDRWMRLSVSYYLLEEELDRTVDRLKSLADENA